MANNRIQIKRSNTTNIPASLYGGELAWSNSSQTLFIGNPDGSNTVTPIASKLNYGVFTANAVLAANTSGAINQVVVGNVVFTGAAQSLNLGGTTGTSGFVLVSNGNSNAYWANATTLTTVNTAAQYTWTNVNTFQANLVITSGNGTNQILVSTIGAASNGVAVTNNLIQIGNTSVYSNLSPAALTTTTVFANVSGSYVNVSGQVNTSTLYVSTSANIASAVYANGSGVYSTGVANAATLSVGTNFIANTTTLTFTGANATFSGANLTVTGTNTYISSNTVLAANVNTTGALTTLAGTNTYVTSNATFTANVNISGSNTVISSTNTNISSAGLNVTGSTLLVSANATLSGANLSVTGTNTYITANQVFAGTSQYTSANATFAGANVVISGTNTYISSNVTLGGSSIVGTSTDLTIRNATVAGNLIVSGTVTSINVQTLIVNDNIIELGDNNTTTDTVDTGFFSPAGNTTNIWYSGLVRQASKSTNTNPYFWLFGSNTNPNTATTIDTSSNSVTGTLQAYLAPYGTGGAFIANTTTVNIVANSTVNVNITANSLVLSTPLVGTSGGTGKATVANNSLLYGNSTNGYNELTFNTTGGYVLQSNGTAIVYDILDGGSF